MMGRRFCSTKVTTAMIWALRTYASATRSDVLMSNHFHLLFEVDRLPAVFRTGALL
jgi:hypothetical protein